MLFIKKKNFLIYLFDNVDKSTSHWMKLNIKTTHRALV